MPASVPQSSAPRPVSTGHGVAQYASSQYGTWHSKTEMGARDLEYWGVREKPGRRVRTVGRWYQGGVGLNEPRCSVERGAERGGERGGRRGRRGSRGRRGRRGGEREEG
eukprot:809110-Rhodomonas_salina.1